MKSATIVTAPSIPTLWWGAGPSRREAEGTDLRPYDQAGSVFELPPSTAKARFIGCLRIRSGDIGLDEPLEKLAAEAPLADQRMRGERLRA